jgi:tight adherence protein B
MEILFFLLLIVFGIYQVYQLRKQQKKTQQLLDISGLGSTSGVGKIEGKLVQYNFGQTVLEIGRDFIYHFKGSDNSTFFKHLAILGLVLAGVYAFNITSLKLSSTLLMPIVAVAASYFIYTASKKRSRTDFEVSFAEAINIVSSSVSVGNTVVSGIEQCGEKLEGTLVGSVFKRIHKRLEIGEDLETVLMDSYNQLRYREYYFFIIAIIINMKGGGQIKEIMSRLGQIITNGRIMDRKKYAKTSEARMSVKILAGIPVFMFFMIKWISPENYEALVNHPIGHIILGYITASTLFGLAIIWSMMNKV